MKDLVRRAGCAGRYEIASAATSSEEIGNPVYPPAQRKLAEHGIGCAGKTARRLTRADYAAWDLLIGMDEENLYNMRRLCGGDPAGKMHLLLEYANRPGEVADPWYTGDFEATWRDVPGRLPRPAGRPGSAKINAAPLHGFPNKNRAACFAARLPPRPFPAARGKTTQLLRLFAPPQAALRRCRGTTRFTFGCRFRLPCRATALPPGNNRLFGQSAAPPQAALHHI